MGWLNRFCARQILRTQGLLLKRIELADKALALCENAGRYEEANDWRLRKARHVNEYARLHLRFSTRMKREETVR